MKKILLTLLIPALFSFSFSPAGGITKPAKGKAVVYFVRTTLIGALAPFSYFDKDKFIGRFSGPGYIRYECEPGEHLFWGRADNEDFMTANLEANKIYLAEAVVLTYGVRLKVVNVKEDEKRADRVLRVINNKEPLTINPEEADKETERLKDAIQEALKKYDEKVAKKRKIERMEKEMFY